MDKTLNKQGSLVEIEIEDLNTTGEGVGRIEGKVVFTPDTVPGDRVLVKLIKVRSKYIEGKLERLLIASPNRVRSQCIVADKCGGCQWQHIDWEYQKIAKQKQVGQALRRIGGFEDIKIANTLHSSYSLNYRNKSTYPLGVSEQGNVKAGYYRKGTHKIVNLNQCPVQDSRLHPLLKQIKEDIHLWGWDIYNEKSGKGKLSHLSLRIGIHTGEILLTLVTKDLDLRGIEKQANNWLKEYPLLVGVCLNLKSNNSNTIFGKQTHTIAGRPYIKEIFSGFELQILSDTFFQINTEAAELLLNAIIAKLNLQGNETVIDAYCGIGTFTLPLARHVKQIIGIESLPSSIKQAKINAEINHVTNASFFTAKVEEWLQTLEIKPDIILLDPPRKGCHPKAIEALLKIQPQTIVYISCKPSTLARDMQILCESNLYQPVFLQPVDFFPQTTHVESFVILQKTLINKT